MKFAIHLLIYATVLAFVLCKDFQLGDTTGNVLISSEKVVRPPFPGRTFINHWYNDNMNRKIKAIRCYDYLNSDAVITVEEGGIDHTYVNLNIVGQAHIGIDYECEMYADKKTVENSNKLVIKLNLTTGSSKPITVPKKTIVTLEMERDYH